MKFFPAGASGGAAAVSALAAPFAGVAWVPTGGIGPDDLREYLDLPGVVAVGGSWMTPRDAIAARDVGRMTRLTAEAVALATGSAR